MLDPKYKELNPDVKLAAFKEIFALLSHTISKGYIDSFGVATGLSKNNAYLSKYEITHPVFIQYFRDTLMDFDDMYKVFKESKKNIRYVEIDDGQINYAIIDDNDNAVFETTVLKQGVIYIEDIFRQYDNDHIFKETSVYDLNIQEFSYAIQNNYTFRANHYIITKEAVPKPKKLISGTYSISEIVRSGEESYIFYTTKLKYPDVNMIVASKVLNLD